MVQLIDQIETSKVIVLDAKVTGNESRSEDNANEISTLDDSAEDNKSTAESNALTITALDSVADANTVKHDANIVSASELDPKITTTETLVGSNRSRLAALEAKHGVSGKKSVSSGKGSLAPKKGTVSSGNDLETDKTKENASKIG